MIVLSKRLLATPNGKIMELPRDRSPWAKKRQCFIQSDVHRWDNRMHDLD